MLGADPVTTIVYNPVIDAAGCARVLAAEAATGYPVHLGTAIPAGSPVCELSSDAGSFGPWSLGSVYGPVEVAKRICASMTATPSPTAA